MVKSNQIIPKNKTIPNHTNPYQTITAISIHNAILLSCHFRKITTVSHFWLVLLITCFGQALHLLRISRVSSRIVLFERKFWMWHLFTTLITLKSNQRMIKYTYLFLITILCYVCYKIMMMNDFDFQDLEKIFLKGLFKKIVWI